jgi:hypothetical protein
VNIILINEKENVYRVGIEFDILCDKTVAGISADALDTFRSENINILSPNAPLRVTGTPLSLELLNKLQPFGYKLRPSTIFFILLISERKNIEST